MDESPVVSYVSCKPVYVAVSDVVSEHAFLLMVKYDANALRENSFTDILRAILLSLEVLIEDPELQINGFILIIDWSNFSFKQASKLTPSILKLAIEGLQEFRLPISTQSVAKDSFPARFGGVHFVNQPWYIHALYTLIKPFLKDKTRKREQCCHFQWVDIVHDPNPAMLSNSLLAPWEPNGLLSQSVVEAGTLKHEDKGENENTQPLLALD
ncbi:hypothetical protein E5288_WYG008048 [Bos mutus]|uniref:CRAL-TRIO domain-containing protein n=1 Tax=Bos mutus TaxID=72004 RepID=A0A6B0RUL6_9CETA|nr:hypothetical protein [Bos mutus]